MKIIWINWINLTMVPIGILCGIFHFSVDNIVWGIFFLSMSVLNGGVFLVAVSSWWEHSLKVANKFVFTCRNCEHQFIPTFWTWFFVPHIGSKRYMRCEKCNRINSMRRK